jgi:hypothetical protein
MRRKKKPQKPNAEYQLPQKVVCTATHLVLGLDPGSKNFGISIVGTKDGKVKVYANSVMMKPVNDLVSFGASSDAFAAELASWVNLYKPSGFTAERFQTRGISGPTIEMVSAMIGLIRGKYPNLPIKLTIASTWKNKVNRRFGVDLKEIYPTTRVQPHQLDATLIAIYGLECGLGTDLSYTLENVIEQCEATSLIPLRRIKGTAND